MRCAPVIMATLAAITARWCAGMPDIAGVGAAVAAGQLRGLGVAGEVEQVSDDGQGARVEALAAGVLLVLLVAVCVFLALTTWREIGRLFGL